MSAAQPMRSWGALIGFIGASFVAGAIGSWATFPHVRIWYPLLNKPAWNPPSAIFAPVWTTLYVLMGIAIWRAWRTQLPAAPRLIRFYFIQLVLNAAWSVIFFALKQPGWALVDILALWGVLVWMLAGFWRTDRLAAVLWAPYVLWVGFATALNAAIVRLN